MSILVTYSSKHGATRDIADWIADGLRAAGQGAEVWPVESAGKLSDYDAFVVGSATYAEHWLKRASTFVRSNSSLLAERPVWLFSRGAPGAEVREFNESIHPRGSRVFDGPADPEAPGFHEWSDIREWALDIAHEVDRLAMSENV